MIQVVFYPPFSQKAGIKKFSFRYSKGMTINGLLKNIIDLYPDLSVHLNPNEFEGENVLVVIKGRIVSWKTKIEDNSEVTLLPTCGGG